MAVTIIDPFDPQMPFPVDLRNRKLNSAQRDTIPANARYEGLMCYVQDEQKWYYLKGGTDNGDWTEFGEGEPVDESLQTVYFNPSMPNSNQGADGDIWFRPVDDITELYQKVSDIWTKLGEWSSEGGGGGSQNLQQVTDIGDTTTNNINIHDPNYPATLRITPTSIENVEDLGRINLHAPGNGMYRIQAPDLGDTIERVIPVSVNGNYAEGNGNIKSDFASYVKNNTASYPSVNLNGITLNFLFDATLGIQKIELINNTTSMRDIHFSGSLIAYFDTGFSIALSASQSYLTDVGDGFTHFSVHIPTLGVAFEITWGMVFDGGNNPGWYRVTRISNN